jgi:hypothetical protein
MEDRIDEPVESDEDLGLREAVPGALDLFKNLKGEREFSCHKVGCLYRGSAAK